MFNKPLLEQKFTVYVSTDSCIEATDNDWLKYFETLDPKILKIKEGATEFIIQPLTTRQRMLSLNNTKKNDRESLFNACEYVVRAGLKEIKNFKVGDKDLKLEFDNDNLLKKEIIDLFQDENIVYDLSSHIKQVSMIPFPAIKKKD